jgi:hypothetical protein
VSYPPLKRVGFWLRRDSLNGQHQLRSYTLSTSVDSRRSDGTRVHKSQSFDEDVLGSIVVTVMDRTAASTNPFAFRQFQDRVNFSTPAAQFGRGKESTYLLDVASVPLALVLALTHKGTPRSIRNRLGHSVILEHPHHVQILEADQAIPIHQTPRQLVLEVPTLVGYLLVLPGQEQSHLLVTLAALLASGQAALQPSQSLLRFSQVARVGDGSTVDRISVLTTGLLVAVKQRVVEQRGKVHHTQVNTSLLALVGRFVYLDLALDRDEILAALGSRNGHVLHLSLNGAVKDGLDPTDLGQVDTVALNLEPLGVTDGLFASLALEGGVVSPLLEEVDVGPVQILEFLLQHLAVCLLEPGVLRLAFQLCKPNVALEVAQALTCLPIVGLAQGQAPVVDEPGVAELDSQSSLLLLIGVYPVLEGFLDEHHTPFCSSMYFLTTSSVTAPTGEMDLLRVETLAKSVFKTGNPFLSAWAAYPLIFPTVFTIPIRGFTSRTSPRDLHLWNSAPVFLLLFYNQFSQPDSDIVRQNLASILGTEDDVILAGIHK